MSELPKHAKVVVVGAGIVGNSMAWHLARLGWRDIVQIDKGPLPNPGGSTGHASNFVYPMDHSKVMTEITADSTRQYEDMGVFRESGGLEVARDEKHLIELRRRLQSAKCWGVEAELLTPDETLKLFPWIDRDVILGSYWSPTVGVVDSLRAGTIMRERAQELEALSVFPSTEILGIDVENGRVKGVRTSRGDMTAEYVVVACGVWSPRIAAMAGATIPLTPIIHQMIDVGPIEAFEGAESEIEYPIIRDMSVFMYERQAGNNLEIGSYAHRPIIHDADDIPSNDEAALSPTEMPFTGQDFDPQLAHAIELLPELLDRDDVEIQYAINGLLSLTPDGEPVLGETVEVKNLWSAAAVWIKEGPGVGRMIAEWMVDGQPEIDPHELDISRLYPFARTNTHVVARACESFNKIYGVVHPMEQWESSRRVRCSPFYTQQESQDAVFYETAGWERPHWYDSNRILLEEYQERIPDRPNEWDARWWSPIINAEHLAMRDRAAMVDLSALAIFDVSGPGALNYVQKMAVNQMDVAVGRAVYTPLLHRNGGFKSDLTIMRTGAESFRVVSGGADGSRDEKWLRVNLPDDGSTHFDNRSSALCTLGLWGPRARDILQSLTRNDVSHEAFPFGTAQQIVLDRVPVWALRISYVGELGWELYMPMENGRYVWDLLSEAGRPSGLIAAGIGVYGTTGRLEKGYRLFGAELEGDTNPVEAGLARKTVKEQDFVGKEAYAQALESEPAAILCTLTVDDHTSSSGEARFMLGREPVLTKDGKRIVDARGRGSYTTSAGAGPSVGKYLLMAYLPPEHAQEGTELLVEYFAEQYPVTVAVAGSKPLFDPGNERMRK